VPIQTTINDKSLSHSQKNNLKKVNSQGKGLLSIVREHKPHFIGKDKNDLVIYNSNFEIVQIIWIDSISLAEFRVHEVKSKSGTLVIYSKEDNVIYYLYRIFCLNAMFLETNVQLKNC
jgi:hypothetical protein